MVMYGSASLLLRVVTAYSGVDAPLSRRTSETSGSA